MNSPRSSTTKTQPFQGAKSSQHCQTEKSEFLKYIFSFLTLLEEAIDTGSKPVLGLPKGQESPETLKAKEVRECLLKLRSIRATSGDCFFHSLA
jgi:hypothetical protein